MKSGASAAIRATTSGAFGSAGAMHGMPRSRASAATLPNQMFSLVLSANLFADSIRDAFDPRAIQR